MLYESLFEEYKFSESLPKINLYQNTFHRIFAVPCNQAQIFMIFFNFIK